MLPKLKRNTQIALFALLILAVVQGSFFRTAAAGNAPVQLNIVSNELTATFKVTQPLGESPATPSSTVEEITVTVDMGDGSEVSRATIRRTTAANGSKHDQIVFNVEQAKQTVERANASGQTTARIVIPDAKDEVSQLDITIPKDAVSELIQGGLNLEIYTDNAKILIPNSSLIGLEGDVYFRVVPIKDETERQEVEDRARVERVVKEVAGDQNVIVVARPMTIETNLSSRAVDIVLPLLAVVLPTDEAERAAFLEDLVIFIEHSDGDRELVKPEVLDYKTGLLGLKFRVNKFSTFTILNMDTATEHKSYMEGYPDGTFKPDRGISRAEMAMILDRLETGAAQDAGGATAFSDVASGHWASSAIRSASASGGLMTGFSDGTFRPEQTITRAEIAAIVSRWLELHGNAPSTFNDVAGNEAEKEIALVRQAGLIEGYPDGSFRPDQPLTRAEAVTLINKILKRGSLEWTSPTWSDVPLAHWAFEDVEEASRTHRHPTIQFK
ncbi:S-layer homology domain-containing protein [Paenibacillus contaminans]|uniref:SLH domain-containing protein n=1 Tax=Paenibacillus contaminans TaxID=450362 RepID=A0A329M6P4_9BACL|nr:S-layer homology domain-containing protein [Paenibacillus contaminans]RAV15581.1 hypothetical protein DQG23_29835 [Paenibacillus contaminans]